MAKMYLAHYKGPRPIQRQNLLNMVTMERSELWLRCPLKSIHVDPFLFPYKIYFIRPTFHYTSLGE